MLTESPRITSEPHMLTAPEAQLPAQAPLSVGCTESCGDGRVDPALPCCHGCSEVKRGQASRDPETCCRVENATFQACAVIAHLSSFGQAPLPGPHASHPVLRRTPAHDPAQPNKLNSIVTRLPVGACCDLTPKAAENSWENKGQMKSRCQPSARAREGRLS